MKKKGLLFVFMLILGMLLCSCSGDSPDKMTGVKLPSGEKLELYMSRDKEEELMSSYDYEVMLKKYNYGFVTLGYTDGLLSYISFSNDSKTKLLNGLGIGSTDYEKYGFQLDGQHVNTDLLFQKVNGKYEKIDSAEQARDFEFQEGFDAGIIVSDDNKVDTVIICDLYTVIWGDYEE